MKTASVLTLLGLVLGVGAAAAAPIAKPPTPAKWVPPKALTLQVTCKACFDAPASCTTAKKDTCRKQARDKFKAHFEGSTAPGRTMLRTNRTQIPADLVEGKYFAYEKTAPAMSSVVWPSGKLTAVPVDLVTRVSATAAAKAHRQPAWDANGQKVKTCDEYGYEQVYDIARFLDAANACKGDRECIFDVALMPATPGIANRTLERKDGTPTERQLFLAEGRFPKNDLFAVGKRYLYANGLDADQRDPIPKDAGLEDALTAGEHYYDIGKPSANNKVKNFTSEWKWHEKLRQKTKDVSQAERDEYERRKAEFRELLAQHAAAAGAEKAKMESAIQPKEAILVLPYDMQTHDPFERYDHSAELVRMVERVRDQAIQKFGPGHAQTPANSINVKKKAQQHGALLPPLSPGHGATGLLAAAGPMQPAGDAAPKTTKPGNAPKAKASKGPSSAANPCNRTEGWGLEMHGHGPISCKIGKFLRDEWARKKAGFKSCLDLGSVDCDWAPEMFSGGVLDSVPGLDVHAREAARCRTWTSGTFSPVAPNLTAATKVIDDNEKLIGAAWRELEPYYDRENDVGLVYKKAWANSESYGDKNWFGAKASYDVGWNAAAAKADGNGNVCEVKGGVHGRANIQAVILTQTMKLFDGAIDARVNQSSSAHSAKLKAHLIVRNEQVFQTGDGSEPQWVTSQVTESRAPLWGEKSDKASFTVVLGVIPVTGSLWGEMLLSFDVDGSGKSPTSCDADSTSFKTHGEFGPTFQGFGTGRVGVGITGVVSAGLQTSINLLTMKLPLVVDLQVKKVSGEPTLQFDSQLDLLLTTLSGRLSVYLELLLYDEEWELYRWNGVGPTEVPLMPRLTAKLPVLGMKKREGV